MFITNKYIPNGKLIVRKCILLTVLSFNLVEILASETSLSLNQTQPNHSQIINKIDIIGIELISEPLVRAHIPLVINENFSDEAATITIKELESLGYFENIKIFKKKLPDNKVDILIKVTEKALLTGYEFTGNKQLSSKKLIDSLGLKNLKTVSNHDIEYFRQKILKEYRKINYFNVKVDFEKNYSSEKPLKIFLRTVITEGVHSKLRKVNFSGCKKLSSAKLRSKIITKEDWLFSGLNGAGRFSTELLEVDKALIQRAYADKGFFNAKVENISVNQHPTTNELAVTFEIEEGELHKVRFIEIQDTEEFAGKELKELLLLEKGEPYSTSKLVDSMDRIKRKFGSKGYIFCDVYPDIKPIIIDGEHYLDIKLMIEKGKIYNINDIKITGNKTTKEYVARRELLVHEGGLANKAAMDLSLRRLEALGYFDRHHLDWKISKVGEQEVDLELNLLEVKTGQGSLGLVGSADRGDSGLSLKTEANFKKRNFMGRGWDLGVGVELGQHKINRGKIDFYNPAVNNSNLFFGTSAYLGKIEYKQLAKQDLGLKEFPLETTIGANLRTGFYFLPETWKIQTAFDFGFEKIDFSSKNIDPNKTKLRMFRKIFSEKFKSGTINWFGMALIKNNLNHPLYPSEGWRLELNTKLALPAFNNDYSMFKTELSGHYYTPIIGKDRLIFSSFAKLGFVSSINNKPVPFKELYCMGGIDSLRGFKWGEAGPIYKNYNAPLGGSKSALMQFELTTPLSMDREFDINTPRGYLFYDIGTAWDAPIPWSAENNAPLFHKDDLVGNNFSPRQTLGLGVKFTVPQPIKIEWGYKLDRNRRMKERAYEWHLFMNIPID